VGQRPAPQPDQSRPQHTTRPHVAFIGHITTEELSRCIAESDLWNGFANPLRALVHRSKLLPSGGGLDEDEYQQVGRRVGDALDRARKVGRMRRTDAAERLWAGMYRALAHRDTFGVVAAVTDRAEAQMSPAVDGLCRARRHRTD
jgi:hypothetical protein